jgi:hypothetical protein
MMSWIGGLFGSKDAVKNIVDKDNGLLTQVGSWIGNFNYTDEEKAEANAQTREWGLRQLDALAPFKVMQRIMVTIIMVEWAILFNCIVVFICLGKPEVVNQLMAFAMTNFAWIPVAGAVGLYLVGGVIPGRPK